MQKQGLQLIVTAFFAAVVVSYLIRLTRTQRLSFRFAVGWISFCLLVALGSPLLPLAIPVSKFVGVTPGVVLLVASVAVLTAISIQLSVSICKLQRQIEVLSVEVALAKVKSSHGNEQESC